MGKKIVHNTKMFLLGIPLLLAIWGSLVGVCALMVWSSTSWVGFALAFVLFWGIGLVLCFRDGPELLNSADLPPDFLNRLDWPPRANDHLFDSLQVSSRFRQIVRWRPKE